MSSVIDSFTSDSTAPAIAFDGTNSLVVWADSHAIGGVGLDIYAKRISQALIPVDASSLLVSGGLSYSQTPALAFDGTNYLAIWADNGQVYLGIEPPFVRPTSWLPPFAPIPS